MRIECIETGQIFASAASAARSVGASPGAMTHHIKGRQKTVRGYRFRITDDARATVRKKDRVIRDDLGNVFRTYAELAIAKGVTNNMAYRWVNEDPERMFRTSRLREDVTFLVLGSHWTVNETRHNSRDEAVSHLRVLTKHFPVLTAHRMLDKAHRSGQAITMRFGPKGWVEHHNNLFGALP